MNTVQKPVRSDVWLWMALTAFSLLLLAVSAVVS